MKKQVYNLGLVAILGLGTVVNAQLAKGVVGINTKSPQATLDVVTKPGTDKSFRVLSSTGRDIITVLDDNSKVGIGTDKPSARLDVFGGVKLRAYRQGEATYVFTSPKDERVGGLIHCQLDPQDSRFSIKQGFKEYTQVTGSNGKWGLNFIKDISQPENLSDINALIVDKDSKVGVGLKLIEEPTARLDVNGDVRIRTIEEGDASKDRVLLADADGNVKSAKLSNLSSGKKLQDLTGGIRKVPQANATEWAKEGTFCLIQTTTATIDMPKPADYKDKILSVNNQAMTQLNYGGSYTPVNTSTLDAGKGHILMSNGSAWYVIGGSY